MSLKNKKKSETSSKSGWKSLTGDGSKGKSKAKVRASVKVKMTKTIAVLIISTNLIISDLFIFYILARSFESVETLWIHPSHIRFRR